MPEDRINSTRRENFAARRIRSSSDFEKLKLEYTEEVRKGPPKLFAILLYTDEDIELAKYIREHFNELHQMSGKYIIVCVIESPPENRRGFTLSFWKDAFYFSWILLGLMQSKPYDKSTAYEIAHSLNIFPDELPCLAFFDKANQADKIIFPIHSDFLTFFRTTFSNIQRALQEINFTYDGIYAYSPADSEETSMQKIKEAINKIKEIKGTMQQKVINKIHESMEEVQEDMRPDRTVYNLYGQTVFVNRQINTEGGAYVEGDVHAGGDFVGRDKLGE